MHQPGEGTVLLNSLLHVVEKAFKHNANNIRIAAYKAWMMLMDNFALNHAVLTTKRRVKLIVRPLFVRLSFYLGIYKRHLKGLSVLKL